MEKPKSSSTKLPSPADRSVKLLKTTDGRDKVYKLAAGLAKLIAFNTVDPSSAKKLNTVAKSLGDARSIMRMAKWVQKNTEVQKEVEALRNNKGDATRGYMKVFRILGDIGYIVGDNVQWLCKYDLLPFDQKSMAHRSKVFQFWGYVTACWLHLYDLLLHYGKAGTLQDATAKKLITNFIRDFCDMLAALATVGYVKSFQPSPGTVASFSIISASIACHQNWKATLN